MRARVWWMSLAILVLASGSGCEAWLDRREERQEKYCRDHFPYGAYGQQQCCPPPVGACPPDGYRQGYYPPSSSWAPPVYSGCR